MTHPQWKFFVGISSMDGVSGITAGALTGGVTPGSATFPASNDALFVPFCLQQHVLIKRLYSVNGTAVSGNIDVGIYSKDGAKIVSSGSTAQSGTSALQFFDVTDFVLAPGCYYFAVALDNTTGTLLRANPSLARVQAIGMAKQASGFALPASATLATVTAAYLPLIGAEITELK